MFKFMTICSGTLVAATCAGLAESPVERGKYLVDAVMACDGCHTPLLGGNLNMERRFSGGSFVWDTPAYTVRGANITPDGETGIGAWSADDLKRLLREGVRPSGVKVAPQMPFVFYQILTPGDLDAVVAYVRSAAPVRNQVPVAVYKAEMQYHPIPNAETPFTDEMMSDPVKRGFYLSTIAHCMECHTPIVNGHRDLKNALGTGGERFEGPWGMSVSRNITSHKTKGIGAWTDEEVKRAITQGVRKDGTKLRPPMGFDWYATMTAADLDAIVAYVRTIPAR